MLYPLTRPVGWGVVIHNEGVAGRHFRYEHR